LPKIDKNLVKQRFTRSLKTYSDQAVVQQQTAEKMVKELIATTNNHKFPRILEIGCGSGIMTRLIEQQLDYEYLLANDLAPQCIEHISQIDNCRFIPGDIETIEYPQKNFDLIISNATFQWLDHLGDALKKFSGWLKPGGIMAFSTFGPENIKELAMLGGRSLNYLSHAATVAITQQNFTIIFEHEDVIALEFLTPLNALQHLKATGVNSLPANASGAKISISTKSALQKFSEAYIKTHSTPNGVSLTYHPVIIIAEKH
jgi:malonyl-CoA O-methyltransferase